MTAVTPTAVTTPTGRAAVFSGVEFDIDEFGPRFGAEIRTHYPRELDAEVGGGVTGKAGFDCLDDILLVFLVH